MAAGWAEAAAPPLGCSPLSGRVWAARPEAEACGKGCGEGREWGRGGEAVARGNGCPAPGEHEREGAGGCAGVRQGCGSGTGELGPRSRFLVRHSGGACRERPGTRQEGTTGDWEEAPRRRS